MPRNGSGVYSLPAAYDIANGTTSDVSQIKTPFEDLETDANAVRPIAAGGTGGATASAARTELGAVGAADTTTITGTFTFENNTIFESTLDVTGNIDTDADVLADSFISDGTGANRLPRGSDAQRPTPTLGDIRMNSDSSDLVEVYADSAWQNLIFEDRAQNIKNKTFEGPTKIETANVSWTGTEDLEPDDGLLLDISLTGNVTTLTDSLSSGESMSLLINDGTDYTITWPTMTWLSGGGTAPTLQTTGDTFITVFKEGTTLYGIATNGA